MANRAAALFAKARSQGGKIAIHFGGEAISYADLAQRVRAAAGGLAKLGVSRGSHVGLLLPSCPDFIVIQQALNANLRSCHAGVSVLSKNSSSRA